MVIITASLLCSLTRAIASSSFSCAISCEREIMTVPADSIWLLKNSPKFFIYIFVFFPSTTVTREFISTASSSSLTLSTAFATSESLPTPEGSITILSGEYCSITFLRAVLKSPTREQQIHPEFISVISIPASLRKLPSIPISPNSFSISTTFCPLNDSAMSFFINVVFPAPKKPEMISIFVIFPSCCFIYLFHYPVPARSGQSRENDDLRILCYPKCIFYIKDSSAYLRALYLITLCYYYYR